MTNDEYEEYKTFTKSKTFTTIEKAAIVMALTRIYDKNYLIYEEDMKRGVYPRDTSKYLTVLDDLINKVIEL